MEEELNVTGDGCVKCTVPGREHLMQRHFALPKRCNVSSVVIRELDQNDEIDAANIASTKITPANKAHRGIINLTEQIRLSLVEVDGKRVNVGGVPFTAMDKWSRRTTNYITHCYIELNGEDPGEVKKMLAPQQMTETETTATGA